MAYDPMREQKRRKNFIQESVIKGIVIAIGCLFLAGEMTYRNGDLSVVFDYISEDLSTPKPGSFLPLPAFFWPFPLAIEPLVKMFFVGFIVWLIWFMTDWIKYDRGKNMRPGEEHGSAGFNLDYGKVLHDYIMSPRILKQMVEERIFYRVLDLKKEPDKGKGSCNSL